MASMVYQALLGHPVLVEALADQGKVACRECRVELVLLALKEPSAIQVHKENAGSQVQVVQLGQRAKKAQVVSLVVQER